MLNGREHEAHQVLSPELLEALRRPANSTIATAWLDWMRDVRRRAPKTVYDYAVKLESFLGWIDSTALEDVALEDIEAWLQRPRTGRGHGRTGAEATLQKEVAVLSGLYAWANARGLARRDPTALLVAPTVRNENPKPVSDGTWIRMWSCEALPAEAHVVLGLGYLCGLRRAEIAALHGSQVNVRAARFEGFVRKGGGDDVLDYGELVGVYADALPRLLPGGPETFLGPLHQAVTRAGDGLLLAWGHTSQRERAKYRRPDSTNDPQLVYKRLAKWRRLAGVEHFTPHQLRHSFVTNLLRADVPIHLVSRLANHSDISITMRYAKLGGQDLRQWRARKRGELRADAYDRWGNGQGGP